MGRGFRFFVRGFRHVDCFWCSMGCVGEKRKDGDKKNGASGGQKKEMG